MADTTEALLGHLAAEARRVYIEERRAFEGRRTGVPSHYGDKPLPRWDGTVDDERPCIRSDRRRDAHGRTYKPVWPELVRFAVGHGADVAALVRARFAVATGHHAPEPPDCKTELALRAYEQRQANLGGKLATSLSSQQMVARTELLIRSRRIDTMGWSPVQVLESVVDDPTLGLTPLFRAIFARENGQTDLFHRLLPGAVQAYHAARPHYDSSPWSPMIPPEVREGADHLEAYARRPAR